jgi:hypothetical protein
MVALAASTWGCFPPVIHGPRVDDGPGIGASLAATTGPIRAQGDGWETPLRVGHVGIHAGYGWASPSQNRPGFFAGFALPAATADVYMQLPPAWTGVFSAGVGAGGGPQADRHAYVQLGQISDAGRGWFITQGFGREPSRSGSPSTVSVTGAALQFTRRRLRTYVHLQYAFGRERGSCPGFDAQPCTPGPRNHSFSLGTTLEGRRPRRR